MKYCTAILLVVCLIGICQARRAVISRCRAKKCPLGKICKTFCVPAKTVCDLPMKVEPCKGAIIRYYYHKQSGTCKQFSWGGCRPNGNNFRTFVECVVTCMDRRSYTK